jgi:hypothetical protein
MNPDYTDEEFKEWFNDVYIDNERGRWWAVVGTQKKS